MKSSKVRGNNGNMIIFVSCMLCIICILLLVAASFCSLVFQQNRLRASADEIALAGARALNRKDRIGQMNNMIARSRHLVYNARHQYEKAQTDYPQLNAMAYKQLDEAREGAELLESQRKHLRNVANYEAEVAVINKFNQVKNTYELTLPWMKVKNLQINHRYLGKIKDTDSNVEVLESLSQLNTHDTSSHFISNEPGMKLYKEGVNAKLPGADSSLDFKISSLPAPVEGTVAPARIASTNAFDSLNSPTELASAVKVQLTVDVSTGLGPHGGSNMAATGTAAATGAGKQL